MDAPRIPLFLDGKGGYCVPGTWGGALADGLRPDSSDIILPKYRNSAFFHTNLDDMLRRGTANDAMSYDYETIIDTDACSAKTPEVAAANVFDMKNMGIKCLSLVEIQERYK